MSPFLPVFFIVDMFVCYFRFASHWLLMSTGTLKLL